MNTMKHLILVALLMVFGFAQAQTVVFSEDFESTPLGVTSSGSSNWALTTQLSMSGNSADTAKITAANDTTILTTNAFSTTGYTNVLLTFNQIAKLFLFDGGYIEVSSNNGSTWTRLISNDYFGQGYYGISGANKFNATSYPNAWDATNNSAVPQNSWWRGEMFELSQYIASSSQAKIRFVLTGVNTANYGWVIDDIEVTASNSELLPPAISLNTPYPVDTVLYTGPFDISANVFDSSGVASAFIVYTIANVADTVQMMSIGGTVYKGTIPSQSYGTTVCYQVFAIDSSSNANKAENPISSCISFTTKKDPNAPASFTYDAAMHSVDAPTSVVIANTISPVKIRIENKGDSLLYKTQIGWDLDGVVQTPYSWTGSLTQDVVSGLHTLGSVTYTPGNHDIRFYTSSPNDSVDQNTSNDTLEMSFYACNSILSGTYTLGGSNADFADFTELMDVLNHCGINASTTIKINPGIYNESLEFSSIIFGLDSLNTLTFVSASNNPNDVVITNGNLTSASHVMQFDSVAWISIKDITIKGNGSGNSSTVHIKNFSHNINIDNCLITAPFANSQSFVGVYVDGKAIHNISLLNNTIKGGYYAVSMRGDYQAALYQYDNKLSGNTVSGFYSKGIEMQRQNRPIITNNKVSRDYRATNTTTNAGIYIYYGINAVIEMNEVSLNPKSASYGIYASNCSGSTSYQSRIVNNMISISGGHSSSITYGFYLYNSGNLNVYHNSVSLSSGSASNGYGFYMSGSSATNVSVNNNVFACYSGAVPFARYSGSFTSLDYNDYYTNGLILMKWSSSLTTPTSAGITGIRALSSADTNSIVANPVYYSPSNLHSYGSAINAAGRPLSSVSIDIDGDQRNSSTPDMGADEFFISSIDVGVLSVVSPLMTDTQSNVVPFKVLIKNYGSTAVTSMNIKYSINGSTLASYAWTGNLALGAEDTVLLNTFTIPAGNYDLTAYTVLTGDTLHSNDTINRTQYGKALVDVEISELLSPESGCGKGNAEDVEITILNNGVGYIYNGVSVSYSVNNGSIISETISDTIAPGGSINYTFNQKADLTTGYQDSTFNFMFAVYHASDVENLNDTIYSNIVSFANLHAPTVSDTTVNYGSVATLNATSTYPVVWYEFDTSTVSVGTGTYTTPILFDTTTYYAQANVYNPPATAIIGNATTTFGPFDASPYGVNMGGGRYQVLYTAAELTAMGITAGNLESIAFKAAYSFSGPSASFEISLGNVPNTTLSGTFLPTLTTVYTHTGPLPVSVGWNTHLFTSPFYWDGTSSLLINVCNVGNPYNAGPLYYTATQGNMVLNYSGMGASCASTMGFSSTKRPNIKIVKLGSFGCYSAKVPLNINVPLPTIDARVSDIVNPKDACGLASTSVTIDVENMGTDTIKGPFAVTYKVGNGTYVSAETINDTIAPNDTLRYTFNTLATLLPGANGTKYVITAKVTVPSDAYAPNDSLMSDSIFSKYTPVNPVVSNIVINYGDSALLSAVSADTVFWYADSLVTQIVGMGNAFQTNPIYDTTSFYAISRKTIPTNNYNIGTGTGVSSYNGPSPYGAGGYSGYGARTQILITAAELKAMGMIQGPISSVSFDVTNMVGTALNNYTIKVGHTSFADMTGSFFESNLNTVYSALSYTEHASWNEHVFSAPFYWNGSSNIIIETCFKNNSGVNYSKVHYTVTTGATVGYTVGPSNFNCADSAVNYFSSSRPNMILKQEGLGECLSDIMKMDVNVINYATQDAALVSIVEPLNSASSITTTPVKVVLRNFGLNNFTSATINWSENGVSQTSYTWTGNMAQGDIDTVTIATNHLFGGGATEIKAWVTLTADTMHNNDTTVSNISVCMNGAYTINPISGDYHSFTEAIADLDYSGICGPVVFNVDSAIYIEQVILYPVQGSSATNTITFQSTDLDSSKVLLSHSTLLNNNYIFMIVGASHIKIKHLGMSANGSTYGNVIVLANKANNIEILNNHLTSSTSTSYSTKASGVYSYRESVDHVLISNNYIKNGYKAVLIEGISADSLTDYIVTHNTMIDFTRSAVEARYVEDFVLSNNDITSSALGSAVYGLYGYHMKGDVEIKKNIITLSSTNTAYGLYISYLIGVSSNLIKINNNFIIALSGSGSSRGINASGLSYAEIAFNSINMSAGGSGSSALYVSSGSNYFIKNNNLVSRNGYALYATSIPSPMVIDYNNYYVDTTNSVKFVKWVSDHADLAALKLFDQNNNQHATSIDPLYYSSSDLHSQQISIYNAGTPVAGITTDIDEDTRSTTAPSIGADEFTPPAIDLGVVAISYPAGSSCGYTSNDSIVVNIKNYGISNLNFATSNATIQLISGGAVVDTITYILNSGTLNSSNSMDVTVTNNFDLSINGQYTFLASTSIAGDGNSNNDNLPLVSVISYPNINSFPFIEGFELGMNISFKELSGDQSDVFVSSTAAYSGNYGLHFQGETYASWSNPSNVTAAFNNTEHVAIAKTCNVDASNLTSLSLQFDLKQTKYSSYSSGNTTSWFRVILIDANGSSHYLKNIMGDTVFRPITANLDPFVRHVFILDNYVGQNFKISFEAVNKYFYGYGSFDGDNAFVDNINLWSPAPKDVAMDEIILNRYHGRIGDSIQVSAAFTNMGSDTLFSVPFAMQSGNGTVVRDTVTGVFLPSTTDTLTFTKYHTITSGTHTVCVFAELPNDPVAANDTACTSLMGMVQYPVDYSDNFEIKTDWFNGGQGKQWIQGTPNKTNMTGAYSGTNAWVTNLSADYASGSEEYLYTPYFTIPSYAPTAKVEFFMFMDVVGSYASSALEYSFDGVNWSAYGYIGMAGSVNWYNQQVNGKHSWATQNSGWNYTSAMLDSTIFNTGAPFQLRFAFVASQNSNTAEGMAIDDFKITISAYNQDAGVVNIINPTVSTVTGDSVTVSISVKNFGSDTLTSIPVAYSVDGTVVATETWTGQLAYDSTEVFTFSTKYMSGPADYSLCAYTMLASDMQMQNDTACESIIATPGAFDAGISTVIAPANQSSIGQPTTVVVRIRNFGTTALTSVPVEYFINGSSKANEVFTGSINPGDSASYTFTTTYVSAGGVYILCATTNLTNDADITNDEVCVSVLGSSMELADANVFAVAQNQPNPANNSTTIDFFIPKSGKVQFKVVNMLGSVVEEQEMNYSSGSNKIILNTQSIESGVYHYSLSFDGQIRTFRMIIVR